MKRFFTLTLTLACLSFSVLAGCAKGEPEAQAGTPIVCDEITADIDGDGIEETAVITTDILREGYAFSPLLTVYKDGAVCAMQEIFTESGYIKPYFANTVDVDGDGGQELHIKYDPMSKTAGLDYCVMALDGHSLRHVSPVNAYDSVFLAISMHNNSERVVCFDGDNAKFSNMMDALYKLSSAGSNITIRMNGPLEISPEGELLYEAEGISADTVNTLEIWIKQYEGYCWEIIRFGDESTRNVSTLFGTWGPGMLALCGHALPGQRLNRLRPTAVTIAQGQDRQRCLITQLYDGRDANIEYSVSKADGFVTHISIFDNDIANVNHNKAPFFSFHLKYGMSLGEVKEAMGKFPYYESSDMLIYVRSVFGLQGFKPTIAFTDENMKKPGFETLHFKEGKLESIEYELNMGYAVNAERVTGNFLGYGSAFQDDPVGTAILYNIGEHRIYSMDGNVECISEHRNADYDIEYEIYNPGTNILTLYRGEEPLIARYLPFQYLAPAVVRCQIRLTGAEDTDGDERDEVLAEIVFSYKVDKIVIDINGSAYSSLFQ